MVSAVARVRVVADGNYLSRKRLADYLVEDVTMAKKKAAKKAAPKKAAAKKAAPKKKK